MRHIALSAFARPKARSPGLMRHWLFVLLAIMAFLANGPAMAKRVNGGLAGGIVPTPVLPPAAGPAQFDLTGFIQEATLDTPATGYKICTPPTDPATSLPDPRLAGGTVKLNGHTIVVPCNTILQMPAFALTWADLFTMAPKDITPTGSGLALFDVPAKTATGLPVTGLLNAAPSNYNAALPSHEIHVVGNIVNDSTGVGQYIAGLIFISQQSLNAGQGVISCINYENGEMWVTGAFVPGLVCAGAVVPVPPAGVTRVRMNDPVGRYGSDHGGPGSGALVIEAGYDGRYTADTDNPTMHSALGYPVCVPSFDPAVTKDPLCPIYNRPKSDVNTGACPSFPIGSSLPALAPTTPGSSCTSWVMDMPGAHATNATKTDPTLAAPLLVGDTIGFHGTTKADANGVLFSAHTIDANLGIYTQPHAKPSYVFMESILVGSGGGGGGGLAAETTNKVSWVGFASDPTELVDMFSVTQNPLTGETKEFYLGTQDPCCTPLGRFRTPANNLGAFGDPQRNYRAVSRTMCQPYTERVDPNTSLAADALGNPLQALTTVCHIDPLAFTPLVTLTTSGVSAASVIPVTNAVGNPETWTATSVVGANKPIQLNGLVPGQYTLPNFEFIFPENLNFGTPLVWNNLQDLPFLFCGSGPIGGPLSKLPPKVGVLAPGTYTVVGQLNPAPWALPMPNPAFANTCPNVPVVGAVAAAPLPGAPLSAIVTSATANGSNPLALASLTTGTVSKTLALVVSATNPNPTGSLTFVWDTPVAPAGVTLTAWGAAGANANATITLAASAKATMTFTGKVFVAGATATPFTITVNIAAASAPTINNLNAAPTNAPNSGQLVQLIATASPSVSGAPMTFKFVQSIGPAVVLSAVAPAPSGTCTAPKQACAMVTFTAPFDTVARTFAVIATEVSTGLAATRTVTVTPKLPKADTIVITSMTWIGDKTIAGLPMNAGKFNITATSSVTLVGQQLTAFLSNGTLPSTTPGSTANPIQIQMIAVSDGVLCGGVATCWVPSATPLGFIDNLKGDNVAPLSVTVKSNLGGVSAPMTIGSALYAIKCTAPSQFTTLFNPLTGVCTVQ